MLEVVVEVEEVSQWSQCLWSSHQVGASIYQPVWGPAESSQSVQGRVRTLSQPSLHLSIPGKPQVGAGGPTPDFGSDLAPGSVYDIRG